MTETTVRAGEIADAAFAALTASGTLATNARPVAEAIGRAEAEGNAVCGLYYLPIFCAHLATGKVAGRAEPVVSGAGAAFRVDARNGFAHPAIAAGRATLADACREFGVAALSVTNSYNALALGHHVVALAEDGLIGLCVSNAPASVAPPGSTRRLFGTNPLAYAVPMGAGELFVVDQSLSAVTKTAVLMKQARGEAIPEGWAQDSAGRPTVDAGAGLDGSLLPAGGQKGANLALLVEVLAAALAGSTLSIHAPGFGKDGGSAPPGVGQFLLAIDPDHFAGVVFRERIADLADAFGRAGVRLPGRRRTGSADDWRMAEVKVDATLWAKTLRLADMAAS